MELEPYRGPITVVYAYKMTAVLYIETAKIVKISELFRSEKLNFRIFMEKRRILRQKSWFHTCQNPNLLCTIVISVVYNCYTFLWDEFR